MSTACEAWPAHLLPSRSEVRYRLPPMSKTCPICRMHLPRVAVALNAQNFVHTRTPMFVYYSGVAASAVEPLRGPPLGGIEVRVLGTHLHLYTCTYDTCLHVRP